MNFAWAQRLVTYVPSGPRYFVVWSLLFFEIETMAILGDGSKPRIAWKEGTSHAVN